MCYTACKATWKLSLSSRCQRRKCSTKAHKRHHSSFYNSVLGFLVIPPRRLTVIVSAFLGFFAAFISDTCPALSLSLSHPCPSPTNNTYCPRLSCAEPLHCCQVLFAVNIVQRNYCKMFNFFFLMKNVQDSGFWNFFVCG